MIQYAAVASDGAKFRAIDREEADTWARAKCTLGCEVTVYGRNLPSNGGGPGPHTEWERVGLWLTAEAR